jgi:hypothetical protein
MGLEGIYKKNAGNCLREPSAQHLASAFTISGRTLYAER